MNTVQKNNNITFKQIQELLEENREKLQISETKFKKLLKGLRKKSVTRQMRKVFYQECLKRLSGNKVSKKGKHLTINDRICIEILHTAQFSISFIADFLDKNRSNIKREMDKNVIEYWDVNSTKSPYKNKGQENIKYYSAQEAQKNADKNKLKNRKKCKLDKYPKLRETVIELLKKSKVKYSPNVISGLIKTGKVKDVEDTIGANAIYRAVHNHKYKLTIGDLPHGRKYYKAIAEKHAMPKEVSNRKKDISIEKMTEMVKNKESNTHFEGDSVVGVRNGTHETLLTLANTASQFVFILRSKNKTGASTVNAFDKLETQIPQLSKIIETLLLDNGVEFSKIDEMMQSVQNKNEKRFQIYFAHPYASYERGCNENKNRLIRRYFRKGSLVENLSDEDILEIARKINNMPRKALGYRTPLEVFEETLKKKNIDTKFLDIYRIELPKCLVA